MKGSDVSHVLTALGDGWFSCKAYASFAYRPGWNRKRPRQLTKCQCRIYIMNRCISPQRTHGKRAPDICRRVHSALSNSLSLLMTLARLAR